MCKVIQPGGFALLDSLVLTTNLLTYMQSHTAGGQYKVTGGVAVQKSIKKYKKSVQKIRKKCHKIKKIQKGVQKYEKKSAGKNAGKVFT